MPNGRYRMLYNHLNSYPRYANQKFFHDLPFFGMIACSSQTHIDVTREELVRVIELYNRLEPLKALLFANSPTETNTCVPGTTSGGAVCTG